MDTQRELNRKVGKLTNERVVNWQGQEAFDCRCSCGGRRIVLCDSFNNANVTCCEECVRRASRPQIARQVPPRVQVSLDHDVLASLGVDLDVEGNASGALIRSLLREYAQLVRLLASGVSLSESVWEALLKVVVENPQLLEENVSPPVRLYLIAERAGVEVEAGPAESVAILSAIRWGLDHPEQQKWWEGAYDE